MNEVDYDHEIRKIAEFIKTCEDMQQKYVNSPAMQRSVLARLSRCKTLLDIILTRITCGTIRTEAEKLHRQIRDSENIIIAKCGNQINEDMPHVSVNFSDSGASVKIGEEKENLIARTANMTLYEYVVLKGESHWLWAYVILNKFESKRPRWQFKNYISKNREDFIKLGLNVNPSSKTQDDYSVLENISEKTESNILDYKASLENADYYENKGEYRRAFDELSILLNSQYKCFIFHSAYMKLCKLIRLLDFKDIGEGNIKLCTSFLRWYKVRLQNGIEEIENFQKQHPFNEYTKSEFSLIVKELESVHENIAAFTTHQPLSQDDYEYDKLLELLFSIDREAPLVISSSDPISMKERIDKAMSENKHLKIVLNKALTFIDTALDKKDMDPSITYALKIAQLYSILLDVINNLKKNILEKSFLAENKLQHLLSDLDGEIEKKIQNWLK